MRTTWLCGPTRAPAAFRYEYHPGSSESVPRIVPYRLPSSTTARFQAESSWPPLGVEGGWVRPEHLPDRCVSHGRGLSLISTVPQGVRVDMDLVVPADGRFAVTLGWAETRPGELEAELGAVRWRADSEVRSACWSMASGPVELARGSHVLRVRSKADRATLDYVDIRPANPVSGLLER